MNYLKFLGLCLCCFLVCTRISAQISKASITGSDPNKPKLFSSLPDRIPVEMQELSNLLSDHPEAGRQVSVDLAERKQLTLSGKIVSSSVKYNNKIRTLVIRTSNFSGATLTLSSSIQPDGTVEYSGRIISFQHGDYYELQKQDNNQYVLVKKNFHELVSD